MSQIMEKTLASIPKLLTQSFSGGKATRASPGGPASQEVQLFMKHVQRARSKSHEASMVQAELSNIQQKLKQSELLASLGVVRSCFTKLIFCHLLGYDVSFAAIYAVNLAQQGQGYDKRLGYLMSCLLLHPRHDMVLLMMATLLRDLKSSNMVNNSLALLVAGELVGEDHISGIISEVVRKLQHHHDLVREKAIYCLIAFYRQAPALVKPFLSQLSSCLTSKDPGVLMALSSLYLVLCREDPRQYVHLGPSFLHILDQINHRGFGTSYYYHMVPLPWLQICLLKILGCLGAVDTHLSRSVSPLLQILIEKTKVTEPISLAILVESVLTVTQINLNEELLNLCSRCIGKLLAADASNSMKYQGLGLLISLSRIRPSYSAQHQTAVVDCLLNDDPVIQARTSHLLHAMANRSNVKAVCAKLLEQIHKSEDSQFQKDTVSMVSDLTERLAGDVDWYLNTYLRLLELKLASHTRDEFIDLVLRKMESIVFNRDNLPRESLIKLSSSLLDILENQDSNQSAVLLSLQIFGVLAPVLTEVFPKASFLSSAEQILSSNQSSAIPQKSFIKPLATKVTGKDNNAEDLKNIQLVCVMTVCKLVLAGCYTVPEVKTWLHNHDYRKELKIPSVQFCLKELDELLQHPGDLSLRAQILFHPEEAELDLSLSFLDALVVQDILRGGSVYKPRYVKLSEQMTSSGVSSGTLTSPGDAPEPTLGVPQTVTAVVETRKKSSSSSYKVPRSVKKAAKWKDEDNDEEQYSGIEQLEGEKDEREKRHQEIAHELFAGLDHNISQDIEFPSSRPQVKSSWKKNIWDDDNDEDTVSMDSTFGIHPFGLPRKVQSSFRWNEDDFDTGINDVMSSQPEVTQSISSQVTDSRSSDILGSLFGIRHSPGKSTNNDLHQSYAGAEAQQESKGTVTSIFAEGIAELRSWSNLNRETRTPGSTIDALSETRTPGSTIDALSDSDPE